ncbi:thioredoxin domain-containing protein [Uliginosibacterium gangwonense]|uniref:thioredoxin domain-containing protein n=1 Tax=Uliginosibacterium gangwonense TaxID=392736 RepID=UPI000364C1C8|nr:thioredoxin domain-containing protein [Uliginosibacterium gangwonense]
MSNRLADESSLYLQQHANDLVDWWPWCDEALQQARTDGKPILLSIGYSACHWCHVMAEESFKDEETATLMNRLFINIKVDREERPDLDQIYQAAHMLLAHRPGGWPLTLALTPEGIPFFAGTYFPKASSGGLPAFADILQHLAQLYAQQQDKLVGMAPVLLKALSQSLALPAESSDTDDQTIIQTCLSNLLISHDRRFGGFYGAPKFPHPAELALLARAADNLRHTEAEAALLLSLRSMANGGLYDHLGGGFARYCIDECWMLPHFEKMLGDNGLLLHLYASAWASSHDELFRRVVEQTAAWLLREMHNPEGGFHASVDADSEGHEGHYYLWDTHEVERLLHAEQLALVQAHYGLDRPPNFERRLWHLHVSRPLDEVAHALAIPSHTARMHIDTARTKLLAAREKRPAPQHDHKVLTGCNAFVIQGLAHAAVLMEQHEWLQAAQHGMDFLRNNLWHEGRLLTAWNDGRSQIRAYLDDHVALIQACLTLLTAEFRPQDLQFAITLAEHVLEHFQDAENGGFFFTADDERAPLVRFKPWHDAASPSGNGLAAQSLIRLGHLTGETRFLDAAKRTLDAFRPQMQTHPHSASSLVLALDDWLNPPETVLISGTNAEACKHWLRNLLKLPGHTRRMMLIIPTGKVSGLPASIQSALQMEVSAQVCKNHQCLPTFTQLASLIETLEKPFNDQGI